MRRREMLLAGAGLAAVPRPSPGGVRRAPTVDDGYGPLGSVEVDHATDAVVDSADRTAFLGAITGFATVDVSDPTDPTVLAERRDLLADHDDGPMLGVVDVTAEGDRLLVPNDMPPDSLTGFLLYDVADPADPEVLAFHETDGGVHNATLRDGVAYLATSNELVVVDVADDDPEGVGSWAITDVEPAWADVAARAWQLHDLWVQDGLAALAHWNAGTWLVDVSDPTEPEYVAHLAPHDPGEVAARFEEFGDAAFRLPPGNHHYAQLSADGSLLAVGKETWDVADVDVDGGPSGIDVWDVADAETPEHLSTIEPPAAHDETQSAGLWTTAHNFDLVGDRLYSSWYQGGVKIHDVSEPEAPEELTWWRRPREAAFLTAKLVDESFFVASSGNLPPMEVRTGLYTFPAEPGEQADPPSLREPLPSPTPSPTATPSPRGTTVPGFGVAAAVAGLGAVGGRYLRRRTRREGQDG